MTELPTPEEMTANRDRMYARDHIREILERFYLRNPNNDGTIPSIDDSLKNRECALYVVEKGAYLYNHLPEEFKNDRQFALDAIEKNNNVLRYVPEKFRNDKQFVLDALKVNAYALQNALDVFKNDKEVVLEAVRSNGDALRVALDKFKGDKEVVLEAIKSKVNGNALQYASASLKHDEEVVQHALENNERASYYVPKELSHLIGTPRVDSTGELVEHTLGDRIKNMINRFRSSSSPTTTKSNKPH